MLCHSIEQNVVWVLEILSKKPSKVKGNFQSLVSLQRLSEIMFNMANAVHYYSDSFYRCNSCKFVL